MIPLTKTSMRKNTQCIIVIKILLTHNVVDRHYLKRYFNTEGLIDLDTTWPGLPFLESPLNSDGHTMFQPNLRIKNPPTTGEENPARVLFQNQGPQHNVVLRHHNPWVWSDAW